MAHRADKTSGLQGNLLTIIQINQCIHIQTKRCGMFSDLIVRVDLQQMWQNGLQIVFYKLFGLYFHGKEQNRPESTTSYN